MQTMKNALLYPNQHEKQVNINQPRPHIMSGSTNAASQGASIGNIFGGVGGRVLGSAIGTAQDINNFAGPYGAPGFQQASAPSHFGHAVSAGMFGQALPQQAIQAAATINPNMNPADVYSGAAMGVRDPSPRGGGRDRERAGGPGGDHGGRGSRSGDRGRGY